MATVTVFEVHRGSGRPARIVEENVSEEKAKDIVKDFCHGNYILEQNYAIQNGSFDDNVIIDENGFWQWK